MPCAVIIMGRHHTDIRQFRIFALILGEKIFVGKTTSPRISAVYSRHRCGSVAATRGILDQEESPALHILETLNCTGSDAYRHILAWIHLFEATGYSSINHMSTAISSECLYPQTEEILKKLRQKPIHQILEQTFVKKPADGNLKQSRKPLFLPTPEKHVQMNLRMTAKDKKEFDRFCKKHQLKAREALGLLLDQITKDDTHLNQLLYAQKALHQENEELKDRLSVQQGDALPVQEQQIAEYLQFLKSGLVDYIQQICPPQEESPLPSFSYKQFHRQSEIRFEYPDKEGFLLLTTEAVLWGRHRSRFVVGQGENGDCLKVRYYPKPLYAGVFPWDYPAGTQWLVGCRQSADGAMEVAAAFPFPPAQKQPEAAAPREIQKKPSLEDQIHKANRTKNGCG